jgi:hypothetical protein
VIIGQHGEPLLVFWDRFGQKRRIGGSAVGLGNIWKFPYVAGANGGGAFVLFYLLCVALIGLPIILAEILLGRRGRRNPAGDGGIDMSLWNFAKSVGAKLFGASEATAADADTRLSSCGAATLPRVNARAGATPTRPRRPSAAVPRLAPTAGSPAAT